MVKEVRQMPEKRFRYEIVANQIGNLGGNGSMQAVGLTQHHTGVQTVAPYDIIGRLKTYCNAHGGRFPYHFYIPMDNGNNSLEEGEDVIYVTQYLNSWVNHNSNWYANRACLSAVLEGNFQIQKPTELQLAKLKQLYDDLATGRFWKELGYIDTFKAVNPRDNSTILEFTGIKVKRLHWHNEVAQFVNGVKQSTACCGSNFIPYVIDYREKQGNVTWGTFNDQKIMDEINRLNAELTKLNQAIAGKDQVIAQKDSEIKTLQDKVADTSNLEKVELEREKALKELHETLIARDNAIIERNTLQSLLDEEIARNKELKTIWGKVKNYVKQSWLWFIENWKKLPRVVTYNVPVILVGLAAYLSLPEYQNEVVNIGPYVVSFQSIVAMLKSGSELLKEENLKEEFIDRELSKLSTSN